MQHPPADKIVKKMSAAKQGNKNNNLNAIERYAASKEEEVERLRREFGSDWFATFPLVNPHKVIEESKTRPLFAAFMLKLAPLILRRWKREIFENM